MLILNQKKDELYDINNIWVDKYRIFTTQNNKNIELGLYKSIHDTKKAFEIILETIQEQQEEQQNNKIIEMPQKEEIDWKEEI